MTAKQVTTLATTTFIPCTNSVVQQLVARLHVDIRNRCKIFKNRNVSDVIFSNRVIDVDDCLWLIGTVESEVTV